MKLKTLLTMKTIIIFLLSVFLISTAEAQNIDLRGATKTLEIAKVDGNLKYSDVKGTPYENKDFLPGKIIFNSGKVLKNTKLRYNNYLNNFEYKEHGKIMIISDGSNIKQIQYNNQNYHYGIYKTAKNKKKNVFFQLLNDGACTLYKLNRIQYKSEHEPEDPFDTYKPDRFESSSPEYFLKFKDKKIAQHIENHRKRKFAELFDPHSSKMLKFLRKANINPRDEDALIQAIKFYNINIYNEDKPGKD